MMLEGLNEREIIRLHRELIAPVAVHEILAGRDELDETAYYTLDVMIAEFQPDTALLCIALCAAHIAQMHSAATPVAAGLGLEAGRIVHDYGPLWLLHADRRLTGAHEGRVIDLLDQMPEDFEAMADLLDALRVHLGEGSDSERLCELLSQNAHGFIDFLEHQAEEDKIVAHKSRLQNLEVHGNVIVFPRIARAHH